MQKLLLSSLLLGVVFYYFFINTIPQFYGVAVLLFEVLFLSSLYFNQKEPIKLSKKQIVFAVIAMLLSIRLTIFTQATLYPINLFLLIICNGLLYSEEPERYGLFDHSFFVVLKDRWRYIGSWLSSILGYCNELFVYIGATLHIPKQKNELLREILIGVSILIGALFVVIPLLSSADLGFSMVMDELLGWFNPMRILSYVGSNFGEVVYSIVSVLIRYSILKHYSEPRIISEFPLRNERVISELRSKIVFYGLNLVYLVFVSIQFRLLFLGNHDAIVGRGFDSYASYIHRGFRQLIIVAGINVGIYSIFESHRNKTWGVYSLITLCVCTGVIILSALLRTSAYIQSYGLTFLRSAVVLICIGFMLVYTYLLFRISMQKRYSIMSLICSIFLSLWIVFSFSNIDSMIVKYNIHAIQSIPNDYEKNWQQYGLYKKSTVLDSRHFLSLSADASNTIREAYDSGKFEQIPHNLSSNNLKYSFKASFSPNTVNHSWYHRNYFANASKKLLEQR